MALGSHFPCSMRDDTSNRRTSPDSSQIAMAPPANSDDGAADAAPDRHAAQRKEQILTQHDPAKLRESREAVVLKEASLFLVATDSGDIPSRRVHAFGLYFRDWRGSMAPRTPTATATSTTTAASRTAW